MVRGRVCLADGGIASYARRLCIPGTSVVTAVPTVDFDAADHHLDREHYSDLLRLAFASAWAPWLVPGWIMVRNMVRRRGRCNYRVSPPDRQETDAGYFK